METKFDNQEIREKTLLFRVLNGVKICWLAKTLGFGKSTLYNFLAGRMDLSQRSLYQLNKFLEERYSSHEV